MRSGRLDRRITIQRKTVTDSDSGEPQEAWTNIVLRRPATVTPVRGDERLSGDQIVASEQVEFWIRYSADVADLNPREHRIVYPALPADSPATEPELRNIYDIHAVPEIGRREGLRILTSRRADAIS